MKKLVLALAVSCAFVSTGALAWGNAGHRAVGAIADKLLKDSAAQKRIQALLLPGETLESIANWPDCVKGTYCGPQSQEMLDYVAANPKHGEYHYTDVPFQLAQYHDHGVGTADDDIVQTLKQAIAVLQGKGDTTTNPHNFTPRQALILIVHMTGDIHQPLHVGAAFVGKDGRFVVPNRQADIDGINIFDARGGNNFLLDDGKLTQMSSGVIPPGEPAPVREGVPQALTKPFHAYWDTTVVDYAMRRLSTRTPEKFAQAVIDSHPVVAGNTGPVSAWPTQWADDALAVSKEAYRDVTTGKVTQMTSKSGEKYNTWSLEVPQNYPVPSSQIAKVQLTKGGYHLAALLQTIWP